MTKSWRFREQLGEEGERVNLWEKAIMGITWVVQGAENECEINIETIWSMMWDKYQKQKVPLCNNRCGLSERHILPYRS